MTFKSGAEKINFAVLEKIKDVNPADIKRAGHLKNIYGF